MVWSRLPWAQFSFYWISVWGSQLCCYLTGWPSSVQYNAQTFVNFFLSKTASKIRRVLFLQHVDVEDFSSLPCSRHVNVIVRFKYFMYHSIWSMPHSKTNILSYGCSCHSWAVLLHYCFCFHCISTLFSITSSAIIFISSLIHSTWNTKVSLLLSSASHYAFNTSNGTLIITSQP